MGEQFLSQEFISGGKKKSRKSEKRTEKKKKVGNNIKLKWINDIEKHSNSKSQTGK